MKVKNLLLAGLAVAAMTACSNDIEGVDNSIPVAGEEANMRLYFNFAEQGTRAAGDPTGTKEEGDDLEWNVDKCSITVVLKYSNDNKSIVIENLQPVAAGGNVFTTEAFQVTAGNNVSVYAFINPSNLTIDNSVDPENLTLATSLTLPDAGLDYLATGIAAPNAFMMSGKTSMNIVGGADETTNKASITVDRVAAKLDEGTVAGKTFKIDTQKEGAISYKNIDDDVNITLEAFSYSNLTNNTFALNGTRSNSYSSASYLQPYFVAGSYPTDKGNDYEWITKAEDNIVTYCLENYGNSNPTKVHYKGQVYIGDKKIESNFYIRAQYNTTTAGTDYYFFEDLAEMKTFYNDAAINAITEATSREKLSLLGIQKYTGGICYYEANINTTVEGAAGSPNNVVASIMRNNWYRLTVNSISQIGTPTPAQDPEDKTTKMIVETTINPWTIQVNGFDL